MEDLSISSFLHHDHEYHLYVYKDLKVPKGVILKDANEILPYSDLFKDGLDSFTCFSDRFRYRLLKEKGGFWVDTDIVCLKHFDFKSDYLFAGEKTQANSLERKKYGQTWINGCIMKIPANSDLMNYCYNETMKSNDELSKSGGWELGPPILSMGIRKYKFTEFIMPYKTFLPINWWEWKDIISYSLLIKIRLTFRLIQNVYAVHLWSSMWNRENLDKNEIFHPKSLYEILKKKYLRLSS